MKSKMLSGLEAIELMKQGKMVIEVGTSEPFILKIENGKVLSKSIMLLNGEWIIDDCFDFTINYEEYTKPLTGWERVGENESYYSINGNCYVEEMTEDMCMEDKYYYEDANYFSTKEKAEEINFKQTLFRRLQRFSDENGGNEIDWKIDRQAKWCIEYNNDNGEIVIVPFYSIMQFGQVYFTSHEVAEQAIQLFHDDLIKYFTTHD